MISIPECTDFDVNFGCDPTIDCGWGKLYVTAEILHHSQLAFYEQARCLFHKKIYLLWNRPDSLLLTMVQDVSYQERKAI
ncbi:hypothetical protein [Microcoleus vaginatus]|uniref:hypothetical protein n=1 Tax=Microcoleus vaginatus TaxID=119532 RepID=UPI0016874DF2|nr:hypothetical protein [Microcoleus sp. FACHB-84]MBD2008500.1 hypothetical protein [Microcoleus sp. FACHB-45]